MTAFRRPGTVSATLLIGLCISLGTAHAIAPEWSRRAGLDVWNVNEVESDYRIASEEQNAVHDQADRAAERRSAARQITTKLIAGTTSLPTATDELMAVFEQDTGVRLTVETVHRGAPTERHRFALHAIDRVRNHLADDPATCATVVARLEDEYEAMCVAPESPPAP